MFQDDIFPPCPSGEPALTAEEWASGVDKDPILKAFHGGSVGGGGGSTGTKVRTIQFSNGVCLIHI